MTDVAAPDGTTLAPDRGLRCFGEGDALYSAYHDDEWAVPVHGELALFERISLEAFQSGLSWLTILRKRGAFRAAFAGFDPEAVARFGEDDVARLLADPGIVRNVAKVNVTIANARAILALWESGRSLDAIVWSHQPDPVGRFAVDDLDPDATSVVVADVRRWRDPAFVPAATSESRALAKELKGLGFRFVGPTTAYAAMQACGVVDDHPAGCPAALSRARRSG